MDGEDPPLIRCLVAFLFWAGALFAHVGSPDIFYQGDAGPYRLLITIRPPQVVPGVAEIEIRSSQEGVESVRVAPLRITAGKQFSPVPDPAKQSKDDPQFFSGSLWLMSTGEWKVLVHVDGKSGKGEIAVPV